MDDKLARRIVNELKEYEIPIPVSVLVAVIAGSSKWNEKDVKACLLELVRTGVIETSWCLNVGNGRRYEMVQFLSPTDSWLGSRLRRFFSELFHRDRNVFVR